MTKQIKLQGHIHRRASVYSKWVQIVEYYQKNGAKETIAYFNSNGQKLSRSHLYYIIGEMNKPAN